MTSDRVVELVREQLQKHHPGGVTLDVGPGPVHQKNDIWYLPVLPSTTVALPIGGGPNGGDSGTVWRALGGDAANVTRPAGRSA
jgi:hypothetical protein